MMIGVSTITRRRYGAGSYDSSGDFVAGAVSTDPIEASVQPAKGEDMELLPEGFRTSTAIRFYTNAELRTADADNTTQPDEVVVSGLRGIDDGTYQVQLVRPYPLLLAHDRVIAVKLKEEAP